jgi:hypothetical protein
MNKPEGIYLCADYRVTDSYTGVFIDDERVKHLTVHYPGDLKALIGFTGIAELKDGTPVGDWLMETLRGQTEVFDASMAHLHSRLKRDFERYRQHLIVTVNVMDGNGRRPPRRPPRPSRASKRPGEQTAQTPGTSDLPGGSYSLPGRSVIAGERS